MARRWCAAGMIEAGKQFRRIEGYRQLPQLRDALTHHIDVAPNGTRDILSAHGLGDSEGSSSTVLDRGGLKVLLRLFRHSLSDGRRAGPSR